jgi:2-polyprenyl-6-methoxyphenol hydroxylase-like FAD-dependent oxidoreductase
MRKPMDQPENVSVLVVGSGPTGLTLACDLTRRGVPCRIIDQAPRHFAGSRAKGLMPRTLEVLDDLGVIGSVLASGGPFPPFRGYAGDKVLWDRSIHEIAGFPKLKPTPDVPYTDFWMLPQWRLEEILRGRLAQLGIRVELATELIGFIRDDDGVTATLAHPRGTELVRTRYLVGADGGRSLVRKALGVSFLGETDESDRSIIADVRADGLDREHWHQWTNPGAPPNRVSLCPLPGTNAFQFVAPITTDDVPEPSLEALQKIFDERSGCANVQLHDMSWSTVYRVNVRLADHFRVGRVFLAGDAAHVHSPAGGQGLNTGVQDAYNLGWKLGAALAGATEELLDSYEAERLPVAAAVLGFSAKLHQQRFHHRAEAGEGPDLNQDVYQLNLNYRSSPLSRDERQTPGRLRAGDRAPDAPCVDAAGTTVRLFDRFRGPHWSLLAFGATRAVLVAAVNERYGTRMRAWTVVRPGVPVDGASLTDIEGHIHRIYDVEAGTAVLVRPDGYVGLITREGSVDDVCAYLRPMVAG